MGRKELVRKTFDGEVAFARLRNRLIHAVIATVAATSPDWPSSPAPSPDTNKNGHDAAGKSKQSILAGLLDELDALRQQLSALFVPHSQVSPSRPSS